jgi:hypothetical protein
MIRLFITFISSVLVTGACFASMSLPKNLSHKDMTKAVEILGFGTSGKILSDPYPLGGYPGLEIGLSIESIPVDDLGRLGDKTEPDDNFVYPKFSIGKGLYNNIDVFVHFIPFSESTGLSEYGANVRWCFYQAKFLPATISFIAHGNSANLANEFSGTSYGFNLVTGLIVKSFSLYLGGGTITSFGRFVGGPHGVTASGEVETASSEGIHTIIGGTLSLDEMFIALEIDQYRQTVFSSKIGLRF